MLPSRYFRYVDGAGIGKISKQKRHAFFKKVKKKHTQEEYEDSVYTLVLKEVASYENEELGTVDIMTDARQVGGRMQRTKVVWPLEKRHTKFYLVKMSSNLMIL